MKHINRILLVFAGFTILSGILFIGYSTYIFQKAYSLSDGSTIKISDSADIATFIGNIVGPLWSLAGIILFYVALSYQRHDLRMQQEELKSTRDEFEINRITSILYKQIELINTNISKFSYENDKSYVAIQTLISHFGHDPHSDYYQDTANFTERQMDDFYDRNYRLIKKYKQIYLNLFIPIGDNVESLKFILESSSVSSEKFIEIVKMMSLNVPAEVRTLLVNIKVYTHFWKLKFPDNYKNYPDPQIDLLVDIIDKISFIYKEEKQDL